MRERRGSGSTEREERLGRGFKGEMGRDGIEPLSMIPG